MGFANDQIGPGESAVRNQTIALLAAFVLAMFVLAAMSARAQAGLSPSQVTRELAAIEEAKTLAQAGRGELLLVGPILSTAEVPAGNVLTIIEYPELSMMKPGSILILAKENCQPIDKCLVARQVIGRDSSGQVQTERYGTAEDFLLDTIRATLLGSVLYAVDLDTGWIHDMRPDRTVEQITLAQALAQEATRVRRDDPRPPAKPRS
jgi:hypothetical protein